MAKFRKKPVVIEAREFAGRPSETMSVCEWVVSQGYPWLRGDATKPETLEPRNSNGVYIDPSTGAFVIRTLEGDMMVSYGDWIIKGIQGEFYPCKPDIFVETYDPVD